MIVGFLISILLELFYKSTSGHTALRPQVEAQLHLFDNRSNWLSYCIWFYCSGPFQEIFPGLLQGSQPSGRGSTWIAGGPVHGRGTQARMVPSGRSVTENFKSWNVICDMIGRDQLTHVAASHLSDVLFQQSQVIIDCLNILKLNQFDRSKKSASRKKIY